MFYSAAYGADTQTVKSVLSQVYANNQYILNDEAHKTVVGISELSDNAVIYEVRAWINSSDYSDAKFDLNEKVKGAFDANGIEIPFNQLDVKIKN